MQIRELLDELLTSLETGPLISAVRHFEAKPAVFAPFPSALDPRIVEALKPAASSSSTRTRREAFETAAGRARGRRHPHRERQEPLLPPAGAASALAREPDARALYLFPTKALARDQEDGAARAHARGAARHRRGRLRRRHAGRRAARGPRARPTSCSPTRTCSTRASCRTTPLGAPLPEPPLRRRSTSCTPTAASSARTWPTCCGGCERVARFHGSSPAFICATATIGNPREHAARLLGRRDGGARAAESGAPHRRAPVFLYNPPVVNAELGIRASYLRARSKLAARSGAAEGPHHRLRPVAQRASR